MTRTSKHGLWTHRFRIIRVLDGAEEMIGLDDELMLANDLHLAKLAFERAKELYPHAVRLKLMHGSRVMDEWRAPEPSGGLNERLQISSVTPFEELERDHEPEE